MQEPAEGLSPELEERVRRAESLAEDEGLLRAFNAAAHNEESWRPAEEDVEAYLETHGVAVPDGLQVRVLRDPLTYPTPDYEHFTIRLFRCRSFWVKKKNEPGYEQVTICFGFEIVPHPISPIG